MRRTTSTWTAAILGAALAAPTVSAQQSPTAATARGSTSTSAAEADPSFGMAAARGARNLLRNGLDYNEYQQFDRALKYLREAERRQDELNEPERQKLVEGIERAQRGLREAIGSNEPYALSERSTRSSSEGSSMAAVASSTGRFAAAKPLPKAAPKSEGDERGAPIQLAGAEIAVPPPPRGDSPLPASPLPAVSAAPATLEIQGLPDLAAAPLELADVEVPTPPPVNRIEAAPNALKAAIPDPEADPAAMAMTDLLAPLPDFERLDVSPPPLGPIANQGRDEAVQLSNAEPAEVEPTAAPAPIMLENPGATEELEAPAPLDMPPPAELDSFNLPPLGNDAVKAVEPRADIDADDGALMNPAPIATPEAPAPRVDDADLDLPALPADLQDPAPVPAMEPEAVPETTVAPEPEIAPEPETEAMSRPASIDDESDALPELPGGLSADADDEVDDEVEAPRMAAATADEPLAPAAEDLNFDDGLPELPDEAPAVAPAPAPAPVVVEDLAEPAPARAPAAEAEVAPRRLSSGDSTLSPELQTRVEEVARRMEAEYLEAQADPQPAPQPSGLEAGRDEFGDDLLRTQTQIDISRAPSPAEARPINAIPVPEDWVPLGAREWSPQRKYWAAAATCHMPLYFQDPMLERYGHSVEKFLGPAGRYFAYPVDSPSQTTQRNQILQPFASAGLFAFQILTWPYALVMDPPWEAQYDLGYWRPGDKIPTDLYYLPLYGTGPPLKGKNY